MKRSVAVIGHADGDGHVITEQTRRNLARVANFHVEAFVDGDLTKGHQAWSRLHEIDLIERSDLVVFVDLMFSPRLFAEEADHLVSIAKTYPEKKFFVIDHHPLPENRLLSADNISVAYRPDVFHCTLGPRSGLMVLAALLERQDTFVSEVTEEYHKKLSLGIRRAAAPGSNVQGTPLLRILESESLSALAEIAVEAAEYHQLVRGRRVASRPKSTILENLALTFGGDKEYADAPTRKAGALNQTGKSMADVIYNARYQVDHIDGRPIRNEPPATRDLETLVTLLEFAAISLTSKPGDTFTRDELVSEAVDLCGDDALVEPNDFDVVLEKAFFLKGNKAALCLR